MAKICVARMFTVSSGLRGRIETEAIAMQIIAMWNTGLEVLFLYNVIIREERILVTTF